MKRLVPVLLVLSLAACGGETPAPVAPAAEIAVAPEAAAPVVTTTPEAPAEPAVPATPAAGKPLTAIPAAYHGRWDATAEDCAKPTDMKLSISGGQLKFHEATATVRSAIAESATVATVDALFQGEGQTGQRSVRLELTPDSDTLIVTNNGVPVTRVRCAG